MDDQPYLAVQLRRMIDLNLVLVPTSTGFDLKKTDKRLVHPTCGSLELLRHSENGSDERLIVNSYIYSEPWDDSGAYGDPDEFYWDKHALGEAIGHLIDHNYALSPRPVTKAAALTADEV